MLRGAVQRGDEAARRLAWMGIFQFIDKGSLDWVRRGHRFRQAGECR
jgi:hypothetical protein